MILNPQSNRTATAEKPQSNRRATAAVYMLSLWRCVRTAAWTATWPQQLIYKQLWLYASRSSLFISVHMTVKTCTKYVSLVMVMTRLPQSVQTLTFWDELSCHISHEEGPVVTSTWKQNEISELGSIQDILNSNIHSDNQKADCSSTASWKYESN